MFSRNGVILMKTRKPSILSQTGTKVGHVLLGFLKPQEVANVLGVNKKTVLRWCETGKLAAVPQQYGGKTTYLVSPQAIEVLKSALAQKQCESRKKQIKTGQKHADFIKRWEKAMHSGLLIGRPFSPQTVAYYLDNVATFLQQYEKVSLKNLKSALLDIPAEQYGKKSKLFKALVSFAKFLIEEQALAPEFLDDVKKYRPVRHKPPKQNTVTEEELNKLLAACDTPVNKALVILLSSTGLRASECAALDLEDIDLDKGVLLVRLGKGNKTRKVGLNKVTLEALGEYLSHRPESRSSRLFLNSEGEEFNRFAIYNRLKWVGKKAAVPVAPHDLRRAFVTINANKGRSLVMLQLACGHSDIKTTRAYCKTTEEEVIDAMKDW